MTDGVRILLAAQDWVTTNGIQRSLEGAGYAVVSISMRAQPSGESEVPRLAVVVTDGASPLGANPAVSYCAAHDIPVVWLSMSGNPGSLVRVPSIRTVGVLVMPVHEAQLLAAIAVGLELARVSWGMSVAVEAVPPTIREGGNPTVPPGEIAVLLERLPLTRRQRDIVAMLLDGGRVSTIAEGLELSPATVRAHLNRIYAKLGIHSQGSLIQAVRSGSWPSAVRR